MPKDPQIDRNEPAAKGRNKSKSPPEADLENDYIDNEVPVFNQRIFLQERERNFERERFRNCDRALLSCKETERNRRDLAKESGRDSQYWELKNWPTGISRVTTYGIAFGRSQQQSVEPRNERAHDKRELTVNERERDGGGTRADSYRYRERKNINHESPDHQRELEQHRMERGQQSEQGTKREYKHNLEKQYRRINTTSSSHSPENSELSSNNYKKRQHNQADSRSIFRGRENLRERENERSDEGRDRNRSRKSDKKIDHERSCERWRDLDRRRLQERARRQVLQEVDKDHHRFRPSDQLRSRYRFGSRSDSRSRFANRQHQEGMTDELLSSQSNGGGAPPSSCKRQRVTGNGPSYMKTPLRSDAVQVGDSPPLKRPGKLGEEGNNNINANDHPPSSRVNGSAAVAKGSVSPSLCTGPHIVFKLRNKKYVCPTGEGSSFDPTKKPVSSSEKSYSRREASRSSYGYDFTPRQQKSSVRGGRKLTTRELLNVKSTENMNNRDLNRDCDSDGVRNCDRNSEDGRYHGCERRQSHERDWDLERLSHHRGTNGDINMSPKHGSKTRKLERDWERDQDGERIDDIEVTDYNYVKSSSKSFRGNHQVSWEGGQRGRNHDRNRLHISERWHNNLKGRNKGGEHNREKITRNRNNTGDFERASERERDYREGEQEGDKCEKSSPAHNYELDAFLSRKDVVKKKDSAGHGHDRDRDPDRATGIQKVETGARGKEVNDGGDRRFRVNQSYPVDAIRSGHDISRTAEPAQVLASSQPVNALYLISTQPSLSPKNPVRSPASTSPTLFSRLTTRRRSERAEPLSTRARSLDLFKDFTAIKEQLKSYKKNGEYDKYEQGSKKAVQLCFEWGLSVETEIRLTEENRRGNGESSSGSSFGTGINDRPFRSQRATQIYRYMIQKLIPSIRGNLEAVGHQEITSFLLRTTQKACFRMFFLQRLWNKDIRREHHEFVKVLAEAKPSPGSAGACSSKSGTRMLELDSVQVSSMQAVFNDLTNMLQMADTIISDGSGLEEAGLECTLS